jgi:hypothetical protein
MAARTHSVCTSAKQHILGFGPSSKNICTFYLARRRTSVVPTTTDTLKVAIGSTALSNKEKKIMGAQKTWSAVFPELSNAFTTYNIRAHDSLRIISILKPKVSTSELVNALNLEANRDL